MIGPATLRYVSKTATTITVHVTVPAVFTAPSTAHAKTLMYAQDGDGTGSGPVEVTATGNAALGPLSSDRTWTVFAISQSDAGEFSVPSNRIAVGLMTVSGVDLSNLFDVPSITDGMTPPHEALASFLEAIEFPVTSRTFTAEKLVRGRNLFVDFLPEVYKERSRANKLNPGDAWVLIGLEPMLMPSTVERFNHKVDTLAVVEVHNGNLDAASADAFRLFQFFLRRENAVGFSGCNISVRLVTPSDVPTLVGEDEAGRATFRFRLVMRSVVS